MHLERKTEYIKMSVLPKFIYSFIVLTPSRMERGSVETHLNFQTHKTTVSYTWHQNHVGEYGTGSTACQQTT